MHSIWRTLSAYLLALCIYIAYSTVHDCPLEGAPLSDQTEKVTAQVWPIKQWKVDFDRAHAQGQQQELLKLIDISNEFALIWFYGEVFTLATPAAPAELKAKISSTLLLIAQRLSEKGIYQPRLLLERRDTDEFLVTFKKVTELQDQLEARAPTLISLDQRLALCFEQIKEPHLTGPTFYALLHRALLRTGDKYLANPTAELALIGASTPLAECALIFEQQPDRWKTLLAYHGGKVPDALEKTLLDQGVTDLWKQIVRQDSEASYRRSQKVIELLKNKSGASKRLSLAALLLVQAQQLGLQGRAQEAIRIIEKVERAFADRGEQEALSQHLGMMKLHLLADGAQWDELALVLSELLKRSERFKRNEHAQRILRDSTKALLKAVYDANAAGRNREALPLLKSSLEALKAFTSEDLITELYPQDLRASIVSEWRLEYAQFLALTARIYEELNDLEQARQQLDLAQKSHPNPQEARALLLGWELDRARLSMDSGHVKVALGDARALLDTLYQEERLQLLGICSWIIANSFHALGQEYNALNYSNYGLLVLSKLKDHTQLQATRTIHADLHSVAAHALAGLGYLEQASTRLKRSLEFKEHEDRRASYVWLLNHRGQYQEALKALDHFKSNPLRAQVLRGCIMAEHGSYSEAVEALQATYALNNDPALALMGRTCLVYAHFVGKIPASVKLSYLLSNLEEATKRSNDPRIYWRWEGINTIAQMSSSTNINQTLDQMRKTVGGWYLIRGESLIQGWNLQAQTFALPRTPKAIIEITQRSLNTMKTEEDAKRSIELTWWAQAFDQPLPKTRLALRQAISQFSEQELKTERMRTSLMSELSSQLLYPQTEERLKDRARLLEATERVVQQPSPYEARLFPQQPQLPSFSPEVLTLYFSEFKGEIYRLTQRGKDLIDLRKISRTQTLSAQLKAWFTALSERPRPWPAGARRDPQADLWKQGTQLAKILLPREVNLQNKPPQLNYWFSPELLQSWGYVPPLEALPLKIPTGRTTGELPNFLGFEIPTFFMADLTAPLPQFTPNTQKRIKRIAQCIQESSCGTTWTPLELNNRLLENSPTETWGISNILLWADSIEEVHKQEIKALPGSASYQAELLYYERSGLRPDTQREQTQALMSHGLKAIAWSQWQAQGVQPPMASLIFSASRDLSVISALNFQRLRMKPYKIDLKVGGDAMAHPYFWAGDLVQFHPEVLQNALLNLKVTPKQIDTTSTLDAPAQPELKPLLEAEPVTPIQPVVKEPSFETDSVTPTQPEVQEPSFDDASLSDEAPNQKDRQEKPKETTDKNGKPSKNKPKKNQESASENQESSTSEPPNEALKEPDFD